MHTKYCQYYSYSYRYGKRILFTWKVNSKEQAIKCLKRMGQSKGWYVVKDKRTGTIINNIEIES